MQQKNAASQYFLQVFFDHKYHIDIRRKLSMFKKLLDWLFGEPMQVYVADTSSDPVAGEVNTEVTEAVAPEVEETQVVVEVKKKPAVMRAKTTKKVVKKKKK